MNLHASVSNEKIRAMIQLAHIFAYPSIWPETSCLCLMEAMSAGLLCVHPNFGALPETAANWTMMYHWHEDNNAHAGIFYGVLEHAVALARQSIKDGKVNDRLHNQKAYADTFYSWDLRGQQWNALIKSLLSQPREIDEPQQIFHYEA